MPTYPPAFPTVAGNVVSVDAFLNNPPMVQRTIEQLTLQRFVADRIFGAGPPTSAGAVLYDQATSGLFFSDRDVQEIEPGSEFPIVAAAPPAPKVATVKKWGGRADVTDESRDRNRYDVLGRDLIKIRNTVVRKVDTVAIAALDAAPILTAAASGDWTTAATDIIGDIETARQAIDQQDLGYVMDAALINPAQATDIRKDADIRTALPREAVGNNLIAARDLNGFAGLTWYITNRVTAGSVYFLAATMAGSISDEQPLTSEVIPERKRQITIVQAWRKVVPYVTDPKAVFKLTGA